MKSNCVEIVETLKPGQERYYLPLCDRIPAASRAAAVTLATARREGAFAGRDVTVTRYDDRGKAESLTDATRRER
jgi:hypothetical protein